MSFKEQVLSFLIVAFGVAVKYAGTWLRAHIKPQQLASVRQLAAQAVRAAESLGVDFGAEAKDKFDFAKSALIDGAKKVGIKLTDAEVISFVQAALDDLRTELDYSSRQREQEAQIAAAYAASAS